VDSRYEGVRAAGVIVNNAVLIAIGIDWNDHRQILGWNSPIGKSRLSWSEFLRLTAWS
jgi:putative transposase